MLWPREICSIEGDRHLSPGPGACRSSEQLTGGRVTVSAAVHSQGLAWAPYHALCALVGARGMVLGGNTRAAPAHGLSGASA